MRQDGSAGEAWTAYTDPRVSGRLLPSVHRAVRRHLREGERPTGLFAVTRLRRSVTVLVVTDLRLFTLGDDHAGLPMVDEVDRADLRALRVERGRLLSSGSVTASTGTGPVSLGTLVGGPGTFDALEELVTGGPAAALPVIPTSRPDDPGPPRAGEPHDPVPPRAPGADDPAVPHPLVGHLSALADLHRRGDLTDEEFATAKARLLADPPG